MYDFPIVECDVGFWVMISQSSLYVIATVILGYHTPIAQWVSCQINLRVIHIYKQKILGFLTKCWILVGILSGMHCRGSRFFSACVLSSDIDLCILKAQLGFKGSDIRVRYQPLGAEASECPMSLENGCMKTDTLPSNRTAQEGHRVVHNTNNLFVSFL